MAKVEIGIRLALDFVAAANAKDAVRLASLFAPEGLYIADSPAPEGKIARGKEEIQHHFEAWFASVPKEYLEVEEAAGLGYRCTIRWRKRNGLAAEENPVQGIGLFVTGRDGIRELHAYKKA
jgi:uncharacterized protein (TIGR02246 family)